MSLEGTLVFSSGRSTDFDIWTLNLQRGELTQLTHGVDLNDSPRWSPDGKRIAYISIGEDLIASLHVMERSGANNRRLTNNMYCQSPSWSADGSKIVFTANAKDKEAIDICVYDFESDSVQTVLSREGIEAEPSFSNDGEKIIFAGVNLETSQPFANRNTDIVEYDFANGTERLICSHPARDYSPVFSPDGRQLAFISHRKGRSSEEYVSRLHKLKSNLDIHNRDSVKRTIRELQAFEQDGDVYVADADGKNIRALTSNSGAESGVRWSPCGKYLVYTSAPKNDNQQERIKIVDAASGNDVNFKYDRTKLLREIGADPENYLNHRFFEYLIPDFIERPLKMRLFGSMFWGEERHPDWSAV